MFTTRLLRRSAFVIALLVLTTVGLMLPACGGGNAAGAGQGLILLAFVQEAVDNAVLNTRLEFRFSEGVDPGTINNASIQIREGPEFGKTVPGLFTTQGSRVFFEPQLAGLCDQSDSGLKPDTQYRVQTIGFPEQFAIRNMSGQPLSATSTYEFHTRNDQDPNKYEDQIPGVGPSVITTQTAPQSGAIAVAVAAGNKIVLPVSENLNPCTVNEDTVLFHMYEVGGIGIEALGVPPHPDGNKSGFSSDGTNAGLTNDQDTGSHFTWGATGSTTLTTPQRILASINLVQSFNGTTIEIVPDAGKFPENAMLVVQLTFEIEDYGNLAMTPFSMSFTTQNLPQQNGTFVVENEGETPWDISQSTADINTARSPSLVQGFMLFAGDGDNGPNQLIPTLPGQPGNCNLDLQTNNGTKDDFDPTADTLLDTGNSRNLCVNSTDGSTAVIWEFNTFRIRSGFVVRVVGVNPAIILVQGDAIIENGGTLKARGTSSSINGQGGNSKANPNGGQDQPGGVGVAGGGKGGWAEGGAQNARFGDDGNAGVGSPDYNPAMPRISPNTAGVPAAPIGGGSAGQPGGSSSSSPWDGSSAGGGGGGHSDVGSDGATNNGNTWTLQLVPRSFGGVVYERNGNSGGRMQLPEAGSGGGSSGFSNGRPWNSTTTYIISGGAGGAGGGFIDLTSSGSISILGTFDVAGGRGGDGAVWATAARNATGGAGGGSGGGGRILTPNDITLGSGAVVTAAGGSGGTGGTPNGNNTAKRNNGGDGANGRLVFETSQGVITGLSGATVIPMEGGAGFYRGPFDATRFQGGGLSPQAVSDVFAVGPFNPMFMDPVQNYGVQEDFIAGTPVNTTLGVGKTAMLVEAQGMQMLPDGTPDTTGVIAAPTGWYTVGQFLDSGVDNLPTWDVSHPNAAQLPPPNIIPTNVGVGITNLNTFEFIQLRITIFLPATVGPFDAGSFIDRWTIRFFNNQ